MLRDLIISNRSCRRFVESVPVTRETARQLIDLARLSASARNVQPLRYIIVTDAAKRTEVCNCLGWALDLPHWPGPAEGERPAAYIVVLVDTELSKNWWCDHGIAAQSILLGARERGLGGCMHGSIKKDDLRAALDIAPKYEILLVISLGKPAEEIVLEEMGPDDDFKYWRDENDVHHVPKRKLDDIIIG